MNCSIGKLYKCEKYFLMFYPDEETAVAAAIRSALGAITPATGYCRVELADTYTSYWTREFGKPVSYLEKNAMFLVLFISGEYIEVLAGDKKGWIIYRDWMNLKESGT